MFDGLYQSLICFFMPYLIFAPANFNTEGGVTINDNRQMGVYIANAAVIVINSYMMMNTYNWNSIMTIVTVVSTLLIFAWTGIYTSFTASFQFYKAGEEVYGTLSFWATTLLTVMICLLPRFTAKSIQKVFFPLDVDIVREQVRLGKFKYLDDQNSEAMLLDPPKPLSLSSSEASPTQHITQTDEERPFYPSSEARASTITGNASAIGSDESRFSAATMAPSRPSYDRPRQSFDHLRPSYEGTRGDMTTSLGLMRIESSQNSRSHQVMRSVDENHAR